MSRFFGPRIRILLAVVMALCVIAPSAWGGGAGRKLSSKLKSMASSSLRSSLDAGERENGKRGNSDLPASDEDASKGRVTGVGGVENEEEAKALPAIFGVVYPIFIWDRIWIDHPNESGYSSISHPPLTPPPSR